MNANNFVSDLFYFPSIGWYAHAIKTDFISLPHCTYNKTYHLNKTTIATAHGAKHLSVPLLGGRNQKKTDQQITLSYAEDWCSLHLKTIASSYGRAPFFENVYPLLINFYNTDFESLFACNLASVALLNQLLGIQFRYIPTLEKPNYKTIGVVIPTYQQVFTHKIGFVPDCSMLDLVMNEGRFAKQMLMDVYQ